MGAGNVQMILLRWPRLAYMPKVAFMQMGLLALDRDSPPLYFGGWAPVARALGAQFPAECEGGSHGGPATGRTGDCGWCAGGQRSARRAVQLLTAAGAVTARGRSGPGRRSEYALWITGSEAQNTGHSMTRKTGHSATRISANTGHSATREHGTTVVPKGGSLGGQTPRGQRGILEDSTGDETYAPARGEPTTPMIRRLEVVPDATG